MKSFKFLFSGWLMALLLLIFAIAIGYATFVENDFGTTAARITVYNTIWFEAILLLMVVNFTGMIFTKQLYTKGKLNILAIHLALIIIIVGAGITRYLGTEGQMRIRNGETISTFQTIDTYLNITLKDEGALKSIDERVLLAEGKKDLLSKEFNWENSTVSVTIDEYIPNASRMVVASTEGDPYIYLIIGGHSGRREIALRKGELFHDGNFVIGFDDTTHRESLQILESAEGLQLQIPESLQVQGVSMDILQERVEKRGVVPISEMSLHIVGEISFIIKQYLQHGKIQYTRVNDNSGNGTPVVRMIVNSKVLMLPIGETLTTTIGKTELEARVGSQLRQLPFSIRLDSFELERYPGSDSPSSYASNVTLFDKANNLEMPYRIYMNNILNYGGYRFFQSSYDQDERGTILSVNHDYWGTFVTYVGYALLFGSLILSLFLHNGRFNRVSKLLAEVHSKRKNLPHAASVLLLLVSCSSGIAANDPYENHADRFGKLFVQNFEGRVEPINTLANKILIKIYKKDTYNKMSADEVFFGMVTNPEAWQYEPIIKVDNGELRQLLGLQSEYATFMDFIDPNGQYKIQAQVQQSFQKAPAVRTTLDKAIINVDERVNVLYSALNRSVLRIFPIQNDKDKKWGSPEEYHQLTGHGTAAGDLFENYLQQLAETRTADYDFTDANATLEQIAAHQRQFGFEIIPSETRATLEIFYNNINIFKNLFPIYLIIGLILIGLFFIQVFRPFAEFRVVTKVLLIILMAAFAAQTLGLGLRWYISDHAPWSNGYESMIYISWATVLAGFLFMKKSTITLGVTSLLAGIALLTAHMSWLNPELTNLVPVLKSYWLTIHVATITSSYGFLAMGCMLAFLNLCIMIFRHRRNQQHVNLTLRELTFITELSLSVGLALLVIGNFLGGIWANESWGRYWGWDAKETWTLVTIILYSFTLHLTLIPSVRSNFNFNFMAFISFGAVLMTYFGVNYYLSGLHSYAGGDPVQVPGYVYYILVVAGLVSVLAAYNEYALKYLDE